MKEKILGIINETAKVHDVKFGNDNWAFVLSLKERINELFDECIPENTIITVGRESDGTITITDPESPKHPWVIQAPDDLQKYREVAFRVIYHLLNNEAKESVIKEKVFNKTF